MPIITLNRLSIEISENKNFPFVANMPYYYTEDFDVVLENTVWVSINDPGYYLTKISPFLLETPRIQVNFQDLTENEEEGDQAPTLDDAKKIVDFLLRHKGCNVLVNCVAGISRSGAVSKFCEEILDYHWIRFSKENSNPNPTLFNLMKEYYENNSKTTSQLREV
jgi:predicted protein tyrosine phosphatase